MLAPVMPEPMITYLEAGGREGVVRWEARRCGGVCQYDLVGLGRGKLVAGLVVAAIV